MALLWSGIAGDCGDEDRDGEYGEREAKNFLHAQEMEAGEGFFKA